MRNRRPWRSLALLGAILALLAVAPLERSVRTAVAGDRSVAEFLMEGGREALRKGRVVDALTKLQKARAEDPTLIEATYWIAAAHEKGKDKRGAAEAYRMFRRLAEAQGEAVPKALHKLVGKATARLKRIDAAGVAIDKAQMEFVERLAGIAKTHLSEDPSLARRIVCIMERASGDHASIAPLRDALDSRSGPSSPDFRVVHKWQDLIANRTFGTNTGWTYLEKGVDVISPRGTMTRPSGDFLVGENYGLVADLRLSSVPNGAGSMLVGVMFGVQDLVGYAALFVQDPGMKDRIALARIQIEPFQERPIVVVEAPAWRPGVARRLGVLVVGNRVRIYVNDKLSIDKVIEERSSLDGELAVNFHNVSLRVDRLLHGRAQEDEE